MKQRQREIMLYVILGCLFFFLIDNVLCKRIIYIPDAGIYVKQVINRQDKTICNYFSLKLVPILFGHHDNLDHIVMRRPPLDFSHEIYLQNDSLIFYPIVCSPPGQPTRDSTFVVIHENKFKIQLFSVYTPVDIVVINSDGSKTVNTHGVYNLCHNKFYNDHVLRDEYSGIVNTFGFGGYSLHSFPSGKRAHIWFLFMRQRVSTVPGQNMKKPNRNAFSDDND